MSGKIIFNAEDQSNITDVACELSIEIENTMPRVPWFSNSKQQDTFKKIVEMISARVECINADQDSKNALIFWILALLYANKKSFQVATASVKNWECAGISPVASTFVSWSGRNINPRDIVAESICSWNKKIGIDVNPKNHNNFRPTQQNGANEFDSYLKESGNLEEIKQMFSSDRPEKMVHKILELSEVRGISKNEALKLFDEMFENLSEKYKNMGLSQDEADEKALNEVIETKISTKDDLYSAGVIGQITEMGEVWNEVNPILSQMKKIPNINNGEDIFDPYIRGYFLGYIDALIEMMGGKSIDASLDAARKIFNIMFGAGFSDDDAGIQVLDECLEERAKQNNSGDFSFSKGFIEGANDYKIFKSGRNPNSLTTYLLKTIQTYT